MSHKKHLILLLVMLSGSLATLPIFVNYVSLRQSPESKQPFPCLSTHKPKLLERLSLSSQEKITSHKVVLINIDESLKIAEESCEQQYSIEEQKQVAIHLFPERENIFLEQRNLDGLRYEINHEMQILKEKLLTEKKDYIYRNGKEIYSTPSVGTLACQNEAYSLNSDVTTSTQNSPTFFSKLNFPLKSHMTCVKYQGSRGTCVAFAIVGAYEVMVSVTKGVKVNLSEQDLYARAKLSWDVGVTSDKHFADGLNVSKVLKGAMVSNYRLKPESSWAYNPSTQRMIHDLYYSPSLQGMTKGKHYTSSCINYINGSVSVITNCSDTNHQARVVSCQFGPWAEVFRKCTYKIPVSNIPSTANLPVVTKGVTLPALSSGTIDIAKYKFLDQKKPLVLALWGTESFVSSFQQKGIVEYVPKEKIQGGHVVLAVAAISNSDLPSDIPHGQGGGYILIKDSYGTSIHNQGYALLSYKWVIENGQGFTYAGGSF